jgi:AraC family transcriptional regulator, regulatory protein of adaptative response / methylated-DNA-[protein]-cysteine methyltransferase
MRVSPNSTSEDYQRIAAAIAFLQRHSYQQPDLSTLAQHLSLSESHLQKLFTRWAGISPKRFVQTLTVAAAKARITQTQSLLDLSLEVGLSSPGRLHDLFVTLEAMSPGEYKSGGAGLVIRYGIHPTRFGPALIATTPRGICQLHFIDGPTEVAVQALRAAWPQATIEWDPVEIGFLGDRLFTLLQAPQPLTLLVQGTNFQVQVWRALLTIPVGGVTTYQRLATQIGRPTAARAVGGAVGSNPIGYLIPCHRVIRESGDWGEYRWGQVRKTAMLGWEASQTCADAE